MPYIKKEDRQNFEYLVKNMSLAKINSAGDLNYLITRLVHSFLEQHSKSYQNYNDALGALEGSKLELYRRFISSYEDVKISANGDVP
jgi:hypothetical protein